MIKRLVSMAIGIGSVAGSLMVGAAGCAHKSAPAMQETVAETSSPHVRRNWLADLALKNDQVASIHARQDKLYVYTDNNMVYVISRNGGTINWASQIGEHFTTILPPLVVGDEVVFPVNTRLFMFNQQSGIQDRAQDIGFAMHAPGVTDGQKMIYIPAAHAEGARLAAVDTTKTVGEVKWEVLARGPITAGPAMYENVIYFGSEDNRIYAVTTSRRPVWPLEYFAFETDGQIKADVKVDDYAVYAASTDTKLYALDRLSGKIKWTYYAEAPLGTPPTPTKDTVYQYAPGKGLVAINKAEGKANRDAKWIAPEAVQVLSVGEKRVYARLKDNTIGALDKDSGTLLWAGSKKYAKFTTNLQDATIFVATADGEVYAFQPAGEPQATAPAPKPATTVPMPNGTAAPQPAAP